MYSIHDKRPLETMEGVFWGLQVAQRLRQMDFRGVFR